jgi:hypothetical protein
MLTKPCVIAVVGGKWEMRWRMLLRGWGRGFVEIDIAAWLSTNGSCQYSKILPIKVAEGIVIEGGRRVSFRSMLHLPKLISFR